jgi:triosephosphate isomerase
VLVGGGISTSEDVRLAFEQGGHATGAASAVSLADDPKSLLRDIAEVFS